MNADRLQWLLISLYFACAILYVYEHNWPKAVYFAGAVILTIGVALMP